MDLVETQEEFEIHFSLVIRERNLNAVKICVYNYRCGSFPDTDINHFVCKAIQTGHVEVMKIVMVAPGVDLNYTDANGKRMLHYASEIGVTDIVSLMIHCGTAVNAADARGSTALHHACKYGQTETVKVLVKEGAHLNRVRSALQGESPLHLACGGGHAETVKTLLALGAGVNLISADDQLQTPLHKAIKGKKYDVIQILCQNGADLSVTDVKGRSPLHLAAETGDIGTLCAILQHGVTDTPYDLEGRKPLHIAIKTKQQLVVEALITAIPGDINAQDKAGLTPLHVATLNNQIYTVELLIDTNAELNLQSIAGDTALNLAVRFAHLEIVKKLLAAGCCPNTPDHKRVTPLHRAQVLKTPMRLEMIDILIKNGTKMNQTDINGYTPLDRCVFQSELSNFDRETFKLMIVAGAHLQPRFAESRKHRNSPLCWLVWRGDDLESARFLVYAGWDLRGENWLDLPGNSQEQEKLLQWLQKSAREPRGLMHHCRQTVRETLLSARDDREILSSIELLPLPGLLKLYMGFEGEKELLEK